MPRSLTARIAAAKTNNFFGHSYRHLVKRCGMLKALVAGDRSILVILWHPLSDPASRCPRHRPDGSFVVLGRNRRFVAGSVAGSFAGGLLLGVIPAVAIVPALAALLRLSAAMVWRHA